MFKLIKLIVSIGVFGAFGAVACGRGTAPAGPSPVVLPTAPGPLVLALPVTLGSTAGGTQLKIIGTNLQRGASVAFGGALMPPG